MVVIKFTTAHDCCFVIADDKDTKHRTIMQMRNLFYIASIFLRSKILYYEINVRNLHNHTALTVCLRLRNFEIQPLNLFIHDVREYA